MFSWVVEGFLTRCFLSVCLSTWKWVNSLCHPRALLSLLDDGDGAASWIWSPLYSCSSLFSLSLTHIHTLGRPHTHSRCPSHSSACHNVKGTHRCDRCVTFPLWNWFFIVAFLWFWTVRHLSAKDGKSEHQDWWCHDDVSFDRGVSGRENEWCTGQNHCYFWRSLTGCDWSSHSFQQGLAKTVHQSLQRAAFLNSTIGVGCFNRKLTVQQRKKDIHKSNE